MALNIHFVAFILQAVSSKKRRQDKVNNNNIIIIIMVIFKCYFSGEHIALSIKNNSNGVNIELGKTTRLNALCMMQINT